MMLEILWFMGPFLVFELLLEEIMIDIAWPEAVDAASNH